MAALARMPTPMKLRHPWLIRCVAFVGAGLIRAWMGTVRSQLVNQDAVPHPADADRARFIYAFWHETLLAPFKLRARVRVLISRHADGELIAQVVQWLGFGVVRGSTNRGGDKALVDLWDRSEDSHLVFTPDGPRGPRRNVQLGMIFLASRTGLPIVPLGVGYSRCWRARSWDRFAVPWPFSKVVFVMGAAVSVPEGLDRAGLEPYRVLVERRMLEAVADAESRATGQPWVRPPHVLARADANQSDPLRSP
jgi:lysophospholipid acyltransferase (LPLAT)-like uncharacterized protein